MQYILIFLSLVAWSDGKIIQGKIIPEKLLQYQNVTGIVDEMLLEILENYSKGLVHRMRHTIYLKLTCKNIFRTL